MRLASTIANLAGAVVLLGVAARLMLTERLADVLLQVALFGFLAATFVLNLKEPRGTLSVALGVVHVLLGLAAAIGLIRVLYMGEPGPRPTGLVVTVGVILVAALVSVVGNVSRAIATNRSGERPTGHSGPAHP